MKVYERKKMWIFVLRKTFPIKVVTDGIIISKLRKFHSKLSEKNLIRCFPPVTSVLVSSDWIKVTRFSWPIEFFSAKIFQTFFLEIYVSWAILRSIFAGISICQKCISKWMHNQSFCSRNCYPTFTLAFWYGFWNLGS